MSCSTLYIARQDGLVRSYKEYRNGYGYAMPIWNYLAKKYLRKSGESDTDLNIRWFIRGQGKEVWDLWKDPRVEKWEKVCLNASFDKAMARREDFIEIAEAFEHFHSEYTNGEPGNVCHYAEMAGDIRALESEVQAIGWRATSVSESLFWVYDDCECPKCGDSHRMQDGRPYDMNKDKGHWWIMEPNLPS